MFKLILAALTVLSFSCKPIQRPNLGRMLGLEGKNGSDGATGAPGIAGTAAKAQSCTVTQLSDGASIQCPDGSSAIILNGKDKKDKNEMED